MSAQGAHDKMSPDTPVANGKAHRDQGLPSTWFWGLAYLLFFVALFSAIASCGGLMVVLGDPTEQLRRGYAARYEKVAGALLVLTLVGGVALWRRFGRESLYAAIAVLASTLLSLVCGEVVARQFMPPWPASALHGVTPTISASDWAQQIVNDGDAVRTVNSWGQRDLERSVTPPPGVRRIVMIGDSFLEASSPVPLPLATERRLGRRDIEVVNLGVSATSPDEYYWRLRKIALPLSPSCVAVVLYAGNDFMSGPKMEGFHGIAAPFPKPSFLAAIGLVGFNHLIANKWRPVLRAWHGAARLSAAEAQAFDRVCKSPDADMPAVLASFVPKKKERIEPRLRALDLSEFYARIRKPDGGLFRTTIIGRALEALDPPPSEEPKIDEKKKRYTLRVVERMAELCRKRGIPFTLIIAPDGSQVDPAVQRLFGSFSHLKEARQFTRLLSEQIARDCRDRGIDVLDLHQVLDGAEGAYLNLDGHWSGRGIDLASEAVGQRLSSHLAAPQR
ncbi:MAG TPA: hypothetical protein PLU30_25700 [Verrucomicrobiae bacterium]|nr:hypothetical protein [Verrucomicrobiae bacterium]